MSVIAATICLVACHGASADHFATFAEYLKSQGCNVRIYAGEHALPKLRERNADVHMTFSIEGQDQTAVADQIAKSCAAATVVITDVGHAFGAKIHRSLDQLAPRVVHMAYYDNPEPYVPGGYSETAAQVMLAAQRILFANANLADSQLYSAPNHAIDLGNRKRIGIGYYPVQQADLIAKRRETEKLKEEDKKILVYFGGNNKEYFNYAFPAFIKHIKDSLLTRDLSNLVIILQQHPAAIKENRDGQLFLDFAKYCEGRKGAPQCIVSDFKSDRAQVIADAAMYYQTSMGPQFVLAGIPTIQIGHETYPDILVRSGLSPSVTDADGFIRFLDKQNSADANTQRALIYEGLGIKANWGEILLKSCKIISPPLS